MAALLKPFRGSGAGRGAHAVPRLLQAAASCGAALREGGHASALRGAGGAGAASDGPDTGVTREGCFWGVFRGFLPDFDFDLPSCRVPQVPYLFNPFIYSSVTKVWSVLSVQIGRCFICI